jgi:hypothetical protein
MIGWLVIGSARCGLDVGVARRGAREESGRSIQDTSGS